MHSVIDTHWPRVSLRLFKQQSNPGCPVSETHFSEVSSKFKAALAEATMTRLGKQSGFTDRLRDITPARLALTMLTAMSSNDVETLADLQRMFVAMTGVQISYKPFHNQLSKPEFADFMRQVLEHMLGTLAMSVLRPIAGSPLAQFTDIVLQDGSSFAIKDILAERFPGRFTATSPAAIELHATMSVFEDRIMRITLAADSQGERDFLPAPGSLKGILELADRGYEDRDYFVRVDAAGGFFVIRVKCNANPKVKECWLADGKVRAFAGKRLNEFRAKLAGQNAGVGPAHPSVCCLVARPRGFLR